MAVPVQSDRFNSALSPVVYGDIALSINTQYNTVQTYLYIFFFCFDEILVITEPKTFTFSKTAPQIFLVTFVISTKKKYKTNW